METILSFLPLIIIVAIVALVVRWYKASKYLKSSPAQHLKNYSIGVEVTQSRVSSSDTKRRSNTRGRLSEIFSSETRDLGGTWRLDPMSAGQLNYLSELTANMGVPVPNSLTKGQASDAIGLFQKPDDFELEQLKFFKVPRPASLTQTDARMTLHEIFSVTENVEKWENRPATTEQKDQIKFLGESVPNGLTLMDAEKIIDGLIEEDEERADRWDDLRMAFEDLVSKDFREMYEIKKFSWKQFCEVIDELERARKIGKDFYAEEELIYESLLKKFPKLRN